MVDQKIEDFLLTDLALRRRSYFHGASFDKGLSPTFFEMFPISAAIFFCFVLFWLAILFLHGIHQVQLTAYDSFSATGIGKTHHDHVIRSQKKNKAAK